MKEKKTEANEAYVLGSEIVSSRSVRKVLMRDCWVRHWWKRARKYPGSGLLRCLSSLFLQNSTKVSIQVAVFSGKRGI